MRKGHIRRLGFLGNLMGICGELAENCWEACGELVGIWELVGEQVRN